MNDPSLVVAGLPAAATPLSLSNAQQLLPPPMVAGPQQLVSGRRAHRILGRGRVAFISSA